MMKKLVLGLVTAGVILAVSACGGKTAENPSASVVPEISETATDTAAESSATEETTGETTLSEEESLVEEKNELVDILEKSDYKAYAKQIQDIVAKKDIEALAGQVIFPVYVKTAALPEGNLVEDKDALVLMAGDIFTDALLSQIASVDTEKLNVVQAGVILGYEQSKAGILIGITEEGQLGITNISSLAE